MTLGILGGGQLGRMSAHAAQRLGLDVRFLVPEPADAIAGFSGVTVADWTDPAVLAAWAADCDAVTVESEWAPGDRLADAAPRVPVWPAPKTLRIVRDKVAQRVCLADAGIPQPAWRASVTLDDLRAALAEIGLPAVVKRRRGSYDGYGNATVHSDADLDAAWTALADTDGVLVEAFVPFVCEAAVIVARTPSGESVTYPVVRTEQRDHRLHAATLPSGLPAAVEAEAVRVALAAADAVGAVGLLAVEVFVLATGEVLVNELAPRPHNSGHVTMEACATSQFENHVRAVLGLPLGSTALRAPAACSVNVLGTMSGPVTGDVLSSALGGDGVTVHLYGKRESRPRRKMGHVNALASTPDAARASAEAAAARLVL